MAKQQRKLKLTLLRRKYGRKPSHLACVQGLGLKRINHTVEVEDTPCNRGMVNKIAYLLKIEEV